MAVHHHHHHHHSGDDGGCLSLIFGALICVGILVYAVGFESVAIGVGLLGGIYLIGQSKKS